MLSKILPHNEHIVDRVLRAILGLAVLSLIFVGPKTLWGLLGIIPLATALIGSCPVYTMFGLSTCKLKTKTPEPGDAQT